MKSVLSGSPRFVSMIIMLIFERKIGQRTIINSKRDVILKEINNDHIVVCVNDDVGNTYRFFKIYTETLGVFIASQILLSYMSSNNVLTVNFVFSSPLNIEAGIFRKETLLCHKKELLA